MSKREEIAFKDFDARTFCLVDLEDLEITKEIWDDLLIAEEVLGTKKLEARMELLELVCIGESESCVKSLELCEKGGMHMRASCPNLWTKSLSQELGVWYQ